MSNRCLVSFPGTEYPSLSLESHQNLSEHLTIQNSPVLFGCRTGICGTCLVAVKGDSPPPMSDEQEMLETLAPQQANVRLACQLVLTADLEICKLKR